MKKKKTVDPELKQILTELEEVIIRLGFKVRFEKGDFEGGYCVLKDSNLIVVNNRNEMEKRIAIVCRCLKQIGITDVFIKPGLRKIIESESARPKEKSSEDEEPGTEVEKISEDREG